MSERILRHSRWDALLIALSLAHGAAVIAVPSIPLIAIGLWWNSNTISHNFIHLPFFRSRLCNRIYSVYLTLLLGFPQSLWRDRHHAHHFGARMRVRLTPAIMMEAALVVGMWAGLLAVAPQFFMNVYLPGYAAGLGLCFIHGYFEHAPRMQSNYGLLYNAPFFNDGYHVEHHAAPGEHWSRLPLRAVAGAPSSRWPAVLRWIELFNLETMERLALRSRHIQQFLLKTHERALRKLLPTIGDARRVTIVGGGMFPRTAILFEKLLPDAELTIVDLSADSLRAAQPFLSARIKLVHAFYDRSQESGADLIVIPLCFVGDRNAMYKDPPARLVLVHDWIWARGREGAIVSPWLLKRLNLIRKVI